MRLAHHPIRREHGPYSAICGAPAHQIPGGFACQAGHSHVDAQTRQEQGWEYAESPDEAARLLRAGVEPRHIEDGRSYP